MEVGDEDGHGRFGVLEEDADGLLCHECGQRFVHLGLHVYRAHGLTAAEYRQAHGLGRRGLVAASTRQALADGARARLPRNSAFLERRDPAKATAARLAAGSVFSPAGLEAMRQASASRRGQQRLGTVVTCAQCGVQFCPLTDAKRRRFCSRSCASKYNRARRSR
ncbi:MucR family transcriptional regulator [Georgenia satyanarayanai]|uniref:MucR family transcriptional regulator n=1 Tax=Georgenia satyanarayanai TaxID=860221 RepID=UPI0034D6F6EF